VQENIWQQLYHHNRQILGTHYLKLLLQQFGKFFMANFNQILATPLSELPELWPKSVKKQPPF
jgi:hypothetical protein